MKGVKGEGSREKGENPDAGMPFTLCPSPFTLYATGGRK